MRKTLILIMLAVFACLNMAAQSSDNGDGTFSFKPDNTITRAEVVTVVNRVTGRAADQDYINKNLEVLDRFTDLKTNSHWAFYDILSAANTIQCADCPHLD